MKKKILFASTSLIPISISPIFLVISCSNAIQDQANQYYKAIFNQSQKTDLGKNTAYPQSVYDAQSLLDNLIEDNEIKNVPSNFELYLNEFDYSANGILSLKVNLVDKSSKQIIEPTSNPNEDFFTNRITIRGFKHFAKDEIDKLEAEYEKFNQSELTFNQKGIEKILDYHLDLTPHINFDNLSSENNITKLLNNFNNNSGDYQIAKIVTNNDPIILDENQSELTFNFGILLAKKNEPTKILNAKNNQLKSFKVPYKPFFKNQLEASMFSWADKKPSEIKSSINIDWIFNNKAKLFTNDSQQLLLQKSWFSDLVVNPLDDKGSIGITVKFGRNDTKETLNQVIISFKK